MKKEDLNRRQQLVFYSFNIEYIIERFGYRVHNNIPPNNENGLSIYSSLRTGQLQKMIKAAHPFSDFTCPASSEITTMEDDCAAIFAVFIDIISDNN